LLVRRRINKESPLMKAVLKMPMNLSLLLLNKNCLKSEQTSFTLDEVKKYLRFIFEKLGKIEGID
jgi:hypothetical protein